MKNHFVSQFIIRRFANAINIFDIKNKKIDLNKRPDRVFYKDDIYTEELEKLMSYNIESRVANILDHKVLNKDEIKLTREELYLLKRYMLICSVRSLTPDYFVEVLKRFTSNADKYLALNKFSIRPYKITKSINELSLTNEDIYLNALKVFSTAATPYDIDENELATKEMLAWAIPFLEGYLAFWDAPRDKEFILSDCSMVSDYDGFFKITGGIEISKTAYLLDRLKANEPVAGVLATQAVMYENYDIFNLSSTRSMILINPFFRLYHNYRVIFGLDKVEIIGKPDIWPAIIQDKSLFDVPKNIYKVKEGIYTLNDEFIYTPKVLNEEDYIYINSLLLLHSKEIIGFDNVKNIIDTIYYHIWEIANYGSIKKENNDPVTVLKRLIEGVKASPYNCLGDYCERIGIKPTAEIVNLFEKILNNLYKDFNENRYICEYYLNDEAKLKEFKQLDFLGEGEKKIEFFKKHLDEIKNKRIS